MSTEQVEIARIAIGTLEKTHLAGEAIRAVLLARRKITVRHLRPVMKGGTEHLVFYAAVPLPKSVVKRLETIDMRTPTGDA